MIFLTAIIGVYFARIEGLNTIRSGVVNLYLNKTPVYEMISGASIAMAAVLLIVPGFITDTIGFLLLLPFTRAFLINHWLKKKHTNSKKEKNEVIEAEIIEDEENKK